MGLIKINNNYYIIGIDAIFRDEKISDHFHTALTLKKEILDKFDSINTKYAPYLLANGVF